MEAFVRVVDTRSFSGAARQLRVGQPAISKAILQLEERLGVQLLLRSTHGLTTTEAGRNYYQHAKRAVEEAAAGEREGPRICAVPREAPRRARSCFRSFHIRIVQMDRSGAVTGGAPLVERRQGDQMWLTPPSTMSSVPVTKALSLDARKTAALPMSSPVPKRPRGVSPARKLFCSLLSNPSSPGVSV